MSWKPLCAPTPPAAAPRYAAVLRPPGRRPLPPAARGGPGRRRAFSLIEVMIAMFLFFIAVFTILALVSNTLRNARALQRPPIDAGMAAAMYVNTNRFFEGTVSGDFDDVENLKDYSYEVETTEAMTNGLLQADVWLRRRGLSTPADHLRILVFDPNFRASPIGPGPRPTR